MKLIDLHTHSTASDGTMKPSELVRYAKTKGLSAIALTDHDTVSGIEEAIRTGEEIGIEVIPGVEISVEYDAELHILGYFVDYNNPEFIFSLEKIRNTRESRNNRIIEKLNKLGFDITMEEVVGEAQGDVVGRPHISSVMVKKKQVKDIKTCFEEYLGYGGRAYCSRERVTPKQGIDLIKNAGGIPVLAHPKYIDTLKVKEKIKELKQMGLLGIEAYYSYNTNVETGNFLRIAIENEMLVTGGTDFHGKNKPELEIGIGLGNTKIKYELLKKMRTFK